jgi:alpha-glucosidase (family GH31 glycosyl hydrolase)
MEAKATSEFFTKIGKRPMIIERSASPGIGKFASHTVGDTFSDIASMAQSMTSIMADNIAGVPLSGSDICGTIYDTTPELCARWHMLGTFYPFSRNHNCYVCDDHEPYRFAAKIYEDGISYTDIMRQAMRLKYSLIKYHYTEYSNIAKEGGVYFKPMNFEEDF